MEPIENSVMWDIWSNKGPDEGMRDTTPYVMDKDELGKVLVCDDCGSIRPEDAFRLVKKGWTPVILRALEWHHLPNGVKADDYSEPEALKLLTENIILLKGSVETPSHWGVLVEPESGAHPFIMSADHFGEKLWGRMLLIEAFCRVGRSDIEERH